MVLVADLLSAALAFVFGSAAVAKLLGQTRQVQTAEKLRIRGIAIDGSPSRKRPPPSVWSPALPAPLAAAAAIGLVALMIGALAFRLRVRDSAGFLLADAA